MVLSKLIQGHLALKMMENLWAFQDVIDHNGYLTCTVALCLEEDGKTSFLLEQERMPLYESRVLQASQALTEVNHVRF